MLNHSNCSGNRFWAGFSWHEERIHHQAHTSLVRLPKQDLLFYFLVYVQIGRQLFSLKFGYAFPIRQKISAAAENSAERGVRTSTIDPRWHGDVEREIGNYVGRIIYLIIERKLSRQRKSDILECVASLRMMEGRKAAPLPFQLWKWLRRTTKSLIMLLNLIL